MGTFIKMGSHYVVLAKSQLLVQKEIFHPLPLTIFPRPFPLGTFEGRTVKSRCQEKTGTTSLTLTYVVETIGPLVNCLYTLLVKVCDLSCFTFCSVFDYSTRDVNGLERRVSVQVLVPCPFPLGQSRALGDPHLLFLQALTPQLRLPQTPRVLVSSPVYGPFSRPLVYVQGSIRAQSPKS